MIKVYKQGTFIENGIEQTYGKLYETFNKLELKNIDDVKHILTYLIDKGEITQGMAGKSECQVSEILRINGFNLQSY